MLSKKTIIYQPLWSSETTQTVPVLWMQTEAQRSEGVVQGDTENGDGGHVPRSV